MPGWRPQWDRDMTTVHERGIRPDTEISTDHNLISPRTKMANSSVVPMTPLPLIFCIWKFFLTSKFPEQFKVLLVVGISKEQKSLRWCWLPSILPGIHFHTEEEEWSVRLCSTQDITWVLLDLHLLREVIGSCWPQGLHSVHFYYPTQHLHGCHD